MLFGSGFERETRSLVIFDIPKARKTVIHTDELVKCGWPTGEPAGFSQIAFHSGLLILKHNNGLSCFELSGLPLRITPLNPPKQFLLMCSRPNVLAINREFICAQETPSKDLLLFNRDFVLNAKAKTTAKIYQLRIRGKTIIGLTYRNCSLEFWQIKDTENVGKELVHFKSVLISEENAVRKSYASLHTGLSLSHNPNSNILHNGFCFYSGSNKIAEFNSIYSERATSELGCVDMLTAQHFVVYKVTNTKDKKYITFLISNIRFLRGVKRITICVGLDLGALLDCQMYFTTIVLFFASGIARLRLNGHKSLYQRVVVNSSSLLVNTRATEERKDILRLDPFKIS